ncbi:MAG: ACT domain-containing protein [Bdellovibrionales bacterium]|nr:ACT domain-containing protein [Bdellovibrionales bacterium]
MNKTSLILSTVEGEYSVCRLAPTEEIPSWAIEGNFFTVSRTADELSIVCDSRQVPSTVKAEHGWNCLKVEGPLDFSLTGILASLVSPLGESGISIFALSTFDTDYLLIGKDNFSKAKEILTASSHTIIE